MKNNLFIYIFCILFTGAIAQSNKSSIEQRIIVSVGDTLNQLENKTAELSLEEIIKIGTVPLKLYDAQFIFYDYKGATLSKGKIMSFDLTISTINPGRVFSWSCISNNLSNEAKATLLSVKDSISKIFIDNIKIREKENAGIKVIPGITITRKSDNFIVIEQTQMRKVLYIGIDNYVKVAGLGIKYKEEISCDGIGLKVSKDSLTGNFKIWTSIQGPVYLRIKKRNVIIDSVEFSSKYIPIPSITFNNYQSGSELTIAQLKTGHIEMKLDILYDVSIYDLFTVIPEFEIVVVAKNKKEKTFKSNGNMISLETILYLEANFNETTHAYLDNLQYHVRNQNSRVGAVKYYLKK